MNDSLRKITNPLKQVRDLVFFFFHVNVNDLFYFKKEAYAWIKSKNNLWLYRINNQIYCRFAGKPKDGNNGAYNN